MKHQIELKHTIENHVPIMIHAEGNDLKSCLANAQFCIDCPDPKHYYDIGDLSEKSYNSIVERIGERIGRAGGEDRG